MEVLKALNNNVIIVLNEKNEEAILMGNGLGFQMKPGACVDEGKIEKVFKLEGHSESEQFERLFLEIPEEIIAISYEILSHAKKSLNKELKETSFIAIADHLYASIQRVEKGIAVKNFLLWDIKRLFPTEMAIAQEAIQMVNQRLHVNLSEDEAGFIALHITNASLNSDHEDAVSLTQLLEEILTVIKYTLRVSFVEEDIYFQRFLSHLKFFSERVLRSQPVEQKENQVEAELFSLVTNQYPKAFKVTQKVSKLLVNRRNYTMSKDEQVYLTIHLARIIDKSKT